MKELIPSMSCASSCSLHEGCGSRTLQRRPLQTDCLRNTCTCHEPGPSLFPAISWIKDTPPLTTTEWLSLPYSSNKLGELSQQQCYNDNRINAVIRITIIISPSYQLSAENEQDAIKITDYSALTFGLNSNAGLFLPASQKPLQSSSQHQSIEVSYFGFVSDMVAIVSNRREKVGQSNKRMKVPKMLTDITNKKLWEHEKSWRQEQLTEKIVITLPHDRRLKE